MIEWETYEPRTDLRDAVRVTLENIDEIARYYSCRGSNTVSTTHGPDGSSVSIERPDGTFVVVYEGQCLVRDTEGSLEAVDYNDFHKQWRKERAPSGKRAL